MTNENMIENFIEIPAETLENAMKCIGKDWLLLTVRDKKKEKVNAMTASWGALGVLWNKNVCICFVRPQRYTHELLEEEESFSVAVMGEKYREALMLCGRMSGRDGNKLAECGLTTFDLPSAPAIAEADILLECKKLYVDELKESSFIDRTLLSNYASGDYHTVYICEIKTAYKRIK